jgi:hypothetical protein
LRQIQINESKTESRTNRNNAKTAARLFEEPQDAGKLINENDLLEKLRFALKKFKTMVRLPGFEPESTAWEAAVLPN